MSVSKGNTEAERARNEAQAIEEVVNLLPPDEAQKFIVTMNLVEKSRQWRVHAFTVFEVCMLMLVWLVGMPWGLLAMAFAVVGYVGNKRVEKRSEERVWKLIGDAARRAAWLTSLTNDTNGERS